MIKVFLRDFLQQQAVARKQHIIIVADYGGKVWLLPPTRIISSFDRQMFPCSSRRTVTK